METKQRRRLKAPICRHCGREWTPPQYVSSKLSYCSACLPEREAQTAQANQGFRVITGLDGSKVIIPARGGYGLRDAKNS